MYKPQQLRKKPSVIPSLKLKLAQFEHTILHESELQAESTARTIVHESESNLLEEESFQSRQQGKSNEQTTTKDYNGVETSILQEEMTK